ncbi:hypothetical protein CK203_091750 [Vitis vinifera]|uniref:Uncharacterized protein n=1 Tax=Vitis vinifera TaxID=29760 RepID=A0A438EJD7_VITVI|nr:hypothetical protein CK203_091750 [Vitis vinifera]
MKKSISRPVTFQRRRSTAALTRSAVLKLCAGNMLQDSGAFVFRALAFLFFISAGVFFWFVLFRSAHYSLYLPFPFPLPVPRAAPSSFNNNNWPATFGLILPSDPPRSAILLRELGFLDKFRASCNLQVPAHFCIVVGAR